MKDRFEDDIPTKPNSHSVSRNTDLYDLVGRLMGESFNHRRRLETLEAALLNQETPGSVPPHRATSLIQLARKTLTTTLVVLAAIISALKELGLLDR